jgi:hypothetical protein
MLEVQQHGAEGLRTSIKHVRSAAAREQLWVSSRARVAHIP